MYAYSSVELDKSRVEKEFTVDLHNFQKCFLNIGTSLLKISLKGVKNYFYKLNTINKIRKGGNLRCIAT